MGNLTADQNKEMLAYQWPLCSDVPRIYIFAGSPKRNPQYWEDRSLLHLDNFNKESIEGLLNSSFALNDDTTASWVTGQSKLYVRTLSGSTMGMIQGIGIPVVGILFCVYCCKALCASDDDELAAAAPTLTKS